MCTVARSLWSRMGPSASFAVKRSLLIYTYHVTIVMPVGFECLEFEPRSMCFQDLNLFYIELTRSATTVP